MAPDLDRKHLWLIQDIHECISKGTFCERDVLALLVLLRHCCEPNSPLREFGDAMAHRERDRGVILSYLIESHRLLERPPTTEGELRDVLFIGGELGTSLNRALALLGLPLLGDLLLEDLVVFVASLLQGMRLSPRDVGQTGAAGVARSYRLCFDMAPRFVGVWGEMHLRGNVVAVPVFGVRNRYLSMADKPTTAPYVPLLNGGFVQVESISGTLSFSVKYGDRPAGILC